ncbi:MAG TPA: GNAT family N-acetyltransferase [Gemmataceae bacterium]|nr:GNAT family N-acetyltransferase [Gemmataceae bacterium]
MFRPAADGLLHTLPDDTDVLFRPVRPEDRERIREGYEQASRDTRYVRFFDRRPTLTDQELDGLVLVDQVMHVAWCALDATRPGLPGVGIGRFVCDPGNPALAELALAVLDEFQGLGVGTIILAVLYRRATELGVRELWGHVLHENEMVIRWLRDLGASVEDAGEYQEARLPVDGETASGDSPTAIHFRLALAELDRCLGSDPGPQ